MSGAVIPVHCPHCDLLFQSRAFRLMGNVANLTLSGNRGSCPRCGQMALMADGVFNIANNVLSVVTAPNITKQMLAAFESAVTKAQKENISTEQLASEVAKIDPSFGEAVRKARRKQTH